MICRFLSAMWVVARKGYLKHMEQEKGVPNTFKQDFLIASIFGKDAIKDTYKRVTKEWLCDYKMFTECVIALNCLCWFFYDKKDEKLSRLFADLYYKSRDDFYDKYTGNGEACDYFFEMTD